MTWTNIVSPSIDVRIPVAARLLPDATTARYLRRCRERCRSPKVGLTARLLHAGATLARSYRTKERGGRWSGRLSGALRTTPPLGPACPGWPPPPAATVPRPIVLGLRRLRDPADG